MGAYEDRLPIEKLVKITTLGDLARHQARNRADATALRFEGRDTSFSELDRLSSRVANGLLEAGLGKGDRIAYIGKNTDHYFELLLGAGKVGIVMVPIGWRLAPAEMSYILSDAECRMVFTCREMHDTARLAADAAGTSLSLVNVDDDGEHGFRAWRDRQSAQDVLHHVSTGDVAVQLYTSGTTGHPKGAMLTHGNLSGSWRIISEADMEWNRWYFDDVSLVALPVSHIGGTGWGLWGLYYGCKGYIARQFDPYAVLDCIENEAVNKMFIVPSALQIIVRQEQARKVDYSRLKYISYGASPIPEELLRECMEVFGCGFVQQYGMTETCGMIVYLPPEDHDPKGNARMRSAGRPVPGLELKVADRDGVRLPANTVGEVMVKSVSTMLGYWKLEEATRKAIDADGWFRTGDAGYMDDDGYLYIHDRVKDMIISGGENIYPAEVENALYGHPDVEEVAVIGVPDEKWGEAVKGVVVLKEGASADENAILEFARQRIARFKVPKSLDFVEALPRNASGKVLKRQLREPYWVDRTRAVN